MNGLDYVLSHIGLYSSLYLHPVAHEVVGIRHVSRLDHSIGSHADLHELRRLGAVWQPPLIKGKAGTRVLLQGQSPKFYVDSLLRRADSRSWIDFW